MGLYYSRSFLISSLAPLFCRWFNEFLSFSLSHLRRIILTRFSLLFNFINFFFISNRLIPSWFQFNYASIVHFHSNLFQLFCQFWNPVIFKNYLVKFTEFLLVIFVQFHFLFIRHDKRKDLRYSRLDSNRNIFFDKVFNHSKMITVIVNIYSDLSYVCFNLLMVYYEITDVLFPSINIINLFLQLLYPFFLSLVILDALLC